MTPGGTLLVVDWEPCPRESRPRGPALHVYPSCAPQGGRERRFVDWGRSWWRWCCWSRMARIYGESRRIDDKRGAFHWVAGYLCWTCKRAVLVEYNWRFGPLVWDRPTP